MVADRGFTGHEYLNYFNVYNMNGRMYDPLVGRFLSADNNIQNEYSTQHYNRYSYCLNNPLRYTDPSGWLMAPIDQYRDLGHSPTNMVDFSLGNYYGEAIQDGWGGHGGGGSSDFGRTLSSIGNYRYDCSTGNYVDRQGNVVSYSVVHNSYITPNASERYTVTETAYSLDGGVTFVGNGNYSLVRLGHAIESTGLFPTFTSQQSGLNYINSFTGRNNQALGGGNWINTTNTVNTWAGAALFTTDWVLTGTRLGSNIGYSLAYKSIGNATKYIVPIGYGTSWIGFALGGYKFAVSNKPWGAYGQLGVSLLSFGLTLPTITAPVGITIGVIDASGWFNGFYRGLDAEQNFYNNTGGIIIPLDGIPFYLQLKK